MNGKPPPWTDGRYMACSNPVNSECIRLREENAELRRNRDLDIAAVQRAEKENEREPARPGDYAVGCDECGEWAFWRKCFQPGRDKGTYVQGRGYVAYRDKERRVCMTRLLRGCPEGLSEARADGTRGSVRPDPDWEELASWLADEIDATTMSKKAGRLAMMAVRAVREAGRYNAIRQAMIEGEEGA